MRIKLSPADRARLDCPEWLDLDLLYVTNREAIVLQRDAGYADPLHDLRDAWNAQLEQGEDGATTVTRVDYAAWTAIVWLALHRAGVKVALGDLEFSTSGVEMAPSEAGDEGKDEAPTTSAD